MKHVSKLLPVFLIVFLFGNISSQAQNLIPNGGFENDLSAWWTQAASGTNASFTVITEDKMEGSKALKVDVVTPGANPWNVQAVNDAWASESGQQYTLTFWAKAESPGSFKVIMQNDVVSAYDEKVYSITESWQQYEWTFTALSADLQLKLHFPSAGTFYIDGFNVPAPSTGPEMVEMIKNGGFEGGLANWWTQAGEGTNASFTVITEDKVQGNNALEVNVVTPGANPWNVQAVNDAWASESGKQYTFTFWAKAATAGSSFKAIMQIGEAYSEEIFTLTETWQQYQWEFTARAEGLQLKMHFPNAGTFLFDEFSILTPSEEPEMVELIKNGNFELGSGNNFTNWWYSAGNGTASFSSVTTDVQEGARALKVEISALGANPWDIQVVNDAWEAESGKEYTLTFWAKAATNGSQFKTVLQSSGTYAEKTYTLTEEWEQYEWAFNAQASSLELKLQFPNLGTFFIDNLSILTEVTTAPPTPPYTPTGEPIAKGSDKFLGNIYSSSQLPYFENYWNQVTPENSGKWASVEGTRDVMNWTQLDAAYNFAKENNFPFRFHVLIWGNQQPVWIESLSPAEQLEEIKEWFAAVAERYPDIDYIEVVNEPLHDAPAGAGNGNYIEALGGSGETGWDWVLESFRLARQYFPETPLMLNEYSVTNTTANAQSYLEIIELLQAENLIDLVGIQAHAFETTVPAAVTAKNLDLIASTTGLPIMITELDLDGPGEQTQLENYQRIFPIFWEHPSVVGVTLWGWKPGMWRTNQGAYLALENGYQRAALEWLREYVEDYVNNSEPVITSGQTLEVSEAAGNDAVVGTVAAVDAEQSSLQNWQITGGSGAEIFGIDAGTGEITVVNQSLLDYETTTSYTLNLRVSDGQKFSAVEMINIEVMNENDNAPIVSPAQVFTLDGGACNVLGVLTATDADDTNQAGFTSFQGWQITGGSGASVFAIDPLTAEVSIENPALLNFSNSSYSLEVSVGDGAHTSDVEVVTISIPAKMFVCHKGKLIQVAKQAIAAHLKHGDCIGACSGNEVETTGIAGQEYSIQVYPNPVKDKLTIALGDNEQNVRSIEILDFITAKSILATSVKEGVSEVVISLGKVKAGMYLLKLNGDTEQTQRIVVE